ncbi:unnamed protein product [Adineta ricciae]|uniref:Uncharacterized protein n=1 Tax=Adineta ricciae TaxID=249248 RepID=A0A814LYG0_ADIRI|nr:unnamed protein product [Adineta ricciae]
MPILHLTLMIFIVNLNQQVTLKRILYNQTLNVEEHSTVELDCRNERQLVAWRISLHHDDAYRYYYINSKSRNEFSLKNEVEEKPQNVKFQQINKSYYKIISGSSMDEYCVREYSMCFI